MSVVVMSFEEDFGIINKFNNKGFICELDDEVNGTYCCEKDLSNLSSEDVLKFLTNLPSELKCFININGENYDISELNVIKSKLN